MVMRSEPVHRGILGVDIERYSRAEWTDQIRARLRGRLYALVDHSLALAGIDRASTSRKDAGDGIWLLVAAEVSTARLLHPLATALAGRLAEDNLRVPAAERMRLRLVVHAGAVLPDPYGETGASLIHAARLLDANVTRVILAGSPAAAVVVVVSDAVYEGVVRHACDGIAPTAWQPIQIHAKETTARAWVHLPGLAVQPPLPTVPEATAAATRTLPRDVASFTGRMDELEQLLAAVLETAHAGRVVEISAIDGMAGIGKTAFAVHAAHRLAARFPDGQLFLDLHAHTAGQSPVAPADALGALLLTTGVEPQAIPHHLDDRAALWRDRLAGKRMLILLDDAAGHEQVGPLLPGAAGCLVLITSRRRLAALEDAERLTLGTLPPAQASALFARLIGGRAPDAEPAAVSELMRLCGYLPLAIRLLAGRLRSHSSWSVRHLTDTLRDAQDRLAELHAENVDVEAAFDLSYQDLSTDQQCLFRHLGLHPGREFDAYAAAALDGTDLAEARRRLEALHDQHLVDEPIAGRYRLHELIRAYARTLASRGDAISRDTAIDRLLDFYLYATAAATQHNAEGRGPTVRPPAHLPAGIPDVSERQNALAWLESERPNLGACFDHAATHGRHTTASRLAHAMRSFLRSAGHWDQALTIHQAAVTSARVTGDRHGQADALNDLGVVQRMTGRFPAAIASLTEALSLYRDLDDRLGQANALNALGPVFYLTGKNSEAAASLTRALAIFRDLGDQLGQADALNALGVQQYQTSEYPAAFASLTEALGLFRDLGDRHGQANALNALGVVQYLTGEYPAAIASLTEALGLYHDLDNRHGQANVLNVLGVVQYLTGEYSAATASLTEALTRCHALDNRLGQANVLKNLGIVQRLTGEHRAATASLTEALGFYRDLGSRLGCANALNHIGITLHLNGEYPAATAALTEALTIFRDLGDRKAEAQVLNNFGALLLDTSGHDDAIAHHRQALNLAQAIGSPIEEARALEGMGRCLIRAHDADHGIACLRRSQVIYQRLGAPDRERVTATLTELRPRAKPETTR